MIRRRFRKIIQSGKLNPCLVISNPAFKEATKELLGELENIARGAGFEEFNRRANDIYARAGCQPSYKNDPEMFCLSYGIGVETQREEFFSEIEKQCFGIDISEWINWEKRGGGGCVSGATIDSIKIFEGIYQSSEHEGNILITNYLSPNDRKEKSYKQPLVSDICIEEEESCLERFREGLKESHQKIFEIFENRSAKLYKTIFGKYVL